MARSTVLLLAFISALAFCDAFTTLVPNGKELVYDYHAQLRAGTHHPTPFASQFTLKGKLHMQNEGNAVLMRLSDLKMKMYNGELQHGHGHDEHHSESLEVPTQAHDLMKVFRVMYDEDHKVKHLGTEMQDRLFSRNFKKALASIMQLDMKQVKSDMTVPHSFITTEDSIYGKGPVNYVVVPEGHDEWTVNKMLNVTHMSNYYNEFSVTDEGEMLSMYKTSEDCGSMDSQRHYHLMKDNTGMFIKKIEAHGGIYLHEMKGFSESQFIDVEQEMILKEMIPLKEKLAMAGDERKEELAFTPEFNINIEPMTDLSMGRSEMKMADYEKYIMTVLNEVVAYMEHNQMEMEKPDMKKSQAINHMVRAMELLDVATLEQMFAKMQEKTTEHDRKMFVTFQEMIPLVGTRATTVFIRNLIRKHKVTDEMAMCMLKKMPFHIRKVTAKLLTEVEDLMSLEDVSKPVHKTAVLSFASMVYKMYVHKEIQELDAVRNIDPELMKDTLLEKYILKFMNLLKSSQDYSMQYLYISALYNIRIGNVVKYLEPYVKGVATTNRHLRYAAICASFGEAVKHPERVFEVYAPILADRSLHLEIRAAAYIMIMSSKPSMTKLWNVYWSLKDEPCPEMYHFHYTFMKSMMYTTVPHLQELKVHATSIMNYMREPYRHPLTGTYFMDYTDPKYGFGAMSMSMILATNTSKAIWTEWSSRLYGLPTGRSGFWMKFDGIDRTKLKMPNMWNQEHSMLDQIWKMVSTLKDQKDIHIEYAVINNDKIVQLDYFDHSGVDKFMRQIQDKKMNMFTPPHISYDVMAISLLPNDLGTVTMFEFMMPCINNNKMEIKDEKIDGTTVKKGELRIRNSKHLFYGMVAYNPVMDLWHGVKRAHSFDLSLPLDFKLSMSKQHNFKLTLSLPKDTKDKMIGMRNYVSSVTYVFGGNNHMLEKSSKISKPWMAVTRGDEHKHSKSLIEFDCIHTGMKYQLSTYGTSHPVSRRTMMALWEHVDEHFFKNYQMMPFGHKLMSLRNLYAYLMLSPRPGSFGILLRGMPSTVYPIDHIDISFRCNTEMLPIQDGVQNKKWGTRATWSTETEAHKVINMWDMNAMIEMTPGHMDNKYKIQFTRTCPDQKEYRVCVEGDRKWMGKEMTDDMHIKLGEIADSKTCPETEVINIKIKGGLSHEQKYMDEHDIVNTECLPRHMYDPLMNNTHLTCHDEMKCIRKYTSMRKFEMDLKKNGPAHEFIKKFKLMKYYLKGWAFPYYDYEEKDTGLDENTAHMKVVYPMIGQETNITFTKKDLVEKITEAPTHFLNTMKIFPNYHFGLMFQMMNKMHLTKSCMVTSQVIYNDFYEVSPMMSHDWMKILETNPDMPTTRKMEMFVKKMEGENDLALKIVIMGETLEMIPTGMEMKITHNGKPMTLEPGTYMNEKMFSMGMMKDHHHTIFMNLYETGMYLDFDGRKLHVERFALDNRYNGLCFTL